LNQQIFLYYLLDTDLNGYYVENTPSERTPTIKKRSNLKLYDKLSIIYDDCAIIRISTNDTHGRFYCN
ncbi:hypothetical protein, partial [Escherichia albertii]|uniref:hypothetical protein n=1 Tax=Escherichia albertii TaxID=208962 RepID=UPI001A7E09B7